MAKSTILYIYFVLLCIGCTKDIGYIPYCDKNPTTYNTFIKSVILSKCSQGYCHQNGAFMGDFTTYSGLKEKIDKGTFRLLVYENKVMPPSISEQLTEDELNKIKCWLDDGAPEN
jgi:hypothetical protein